LSLEGERVPVFSIQLVKDIARGNVWGSHNLL
jgi:hypothetical protein